MKRNVLFERTKAVESSRKQWKRKGAVSAIKAVEIPAKGLQGRVTSSPAAQDLRDPRTGDPQIGEFVARVEHPISIASH